ncbi:MAG: hypothetical protein CMH57_01310 [Myxococcales bacterium]|nr:hypothetical protein [Myxococcales bacterium]
MYRLLSIALIAFALCACSNTNDGGTPSGGTVDVSNDFTPRGAQTAGYRVVQHQELQIKVWYPAQGDAAAPIDYSVALKFPGFPPDPVVIHGTAALDAPVAEGGPYPLVVLSHGFGLNPEWYHALAEHLASHGFVVLAPEHTEADWFEDVLVATANRPVEVSAVIDFAELPAQRSWIDAERVAVLGHSYGGYTALAAAGARLDPASLAARCEGVDDPMMSSYFCDSFLSNEATLAENMGLDEVPGGLWPSMADARVDTIVSIAGDAYLFGEEGLSSVSVPVMFIGGTADTGTPWSWGSQLSFEHVASDERALVGLEGAEHMIATARCEDMPFTASMPDEYAGYFCQDPAWEKSRAHDVIHHLTTAWLKHTLDQHGEALEALDPARFADDETLSVSLGQ